MMNLNEALDYIHNLYRKGSVPGLHRMQQMLEMMGNPQKKLKFIPVFLEGVVVLSKGRWRGGIQFAQI